MRHTLCTLLDCAHEFASLHHRMRTSRRCRRDTRAPCTLDHAPTPVARAIRFKSDHGRGAIKSFPTTRMRRLCARNRSIERPRHVGVRSARRHARAPVCPLHAGDSRQQSVPASRSGVRHPDTTVNAGAPTWTAPCTRPPPCVQLIRHTEVRCCASLGRTPALALDLWTTPPRTKPSWASFFPAAAPPRAISRVGPRRTGSSRPLRSKKHAHSGPPLRCGRHGSAVRRRP